MLTLLSFGLDHVKWADNKEKRLLDIIIQSDRAQVRFLLSLDERRNNELLITVTATISETLLG